MNTLRSLIITVIIGISVGLDRYTKEWALNTLKGEPSQSYFNDFFRFVFAYNEGAFLSAGSNLPEILHLFLLKVFPVAMLLVLLIYTFVSTKLNNWQIVAFSFILGGGISNVLDRIVYGKVVDFMNMGFDGLRTGIFNVADVSIMIGLFMMVFAVFKQK